MTLRSAICGLFCAVFGHRYQKASSLDCGYRQRYVGCKRCGGEWLMDVTGEKIPWTAKLEGIFTRRSGQEET